jgi:hypothetical protein
MGSALVPTQTSAMKSRLAVHGLQPRATEARGATSGRRRIVLLLSVAVAALALVGCSIGDDGRRITQSRQVADFTRIDNPESVDVQLRVGGPRRVGVSAGEKVIDDVGTEVRDGALLVTFDHSGWGGDDVVVEASVPKLEGIETSGSGDVDAYGIHADAFEVRSDGSSDITLEGTVRRLALELDGSGDADLADLAALAARVFAGGSGDANLRVDERLDVSLDGSGDVRYYGDPALTQHLDGSGELSRAD